MRLCVIFLLDFYDRLSACSDKRNGWVACVSGLPEEIQHYPIQDAGKN